MADKKIITVYISKDLIARMNKLPRTLLPNRSALIESLLEPIIRKLEKEEINGR